MNPSAKQRWWPRLLLVAVAAVSLSWGGGDHADRGMSLTFYVENNATQS